MEEKDLISVSEGILFDAKADMTHEKVLSIPIAELSALGAGVSSLIPALNTVTQTTTINTQGVYRLANAAVGDTLKVAKNGNFWGAFKTAEGGSKFAQLQEAGPLTATMETVVPFNPATMMMAAALLFIEKKLGNIEDMQKQIQSFLEMEKESEIEADVETLVDMMRKYKFNWDNEHFVASNHKMALDIQRTARKNINVYQKKVTEALDSRRSLPAQKNVEAKLNTFRKDFIYYKLSLYTFSLASLLEILLSGNFQEEYISGIKEEIRGLSETYRDLFRECSVYLEKIGKSAIGTNVLKGLGEVGKAAGNLIGSIPVIKEGPVDEFLVDRGTHLKELALDTEKRSVKEFASVGNPGTGMFIDQMEEMVQIYNHTGQFCFDDKNIYLIET